MGEEGGITSDGVESLDLMNEDIIMFKFWRRYLVFKFRYID